MNYKQKYIYCNQYNLVFNQLVLVIIIIIISENWKNDRKSKWI